MPGINQLQLPNFQPAPQVDWSAFNRIGDVIAGYRRKQNIADVLLTNTDPSGQLDVERAGAALAQAGLLDEARPMLALAQQKAALGQSAAGQAETARHNKAMEGLAAEKPAIVWQEDAAGNKTPYVVDARKGTVAPVPIPGATETAPNPYATAKLTETQGKDALYASRMMNAENVLSDPAVINAATSRVERGKAAVPFVANSLVSADYQKYDQAQRDFVNATLRRESGAAISQSEFDNANKQYFPQPGDGPEDLQQKALNRAEAIRGFAAGAGAEVDTAVCIQ